MTAAPGLAAEATVLTVAVLAGNTLLRPLVNAINRAPIDERKSEAIYEVHVVTAPETVGEVRDLLAEELDDYPSVSILQSRQPNYSTEHAH